MHTPTSDKAKEKEESPIIRFAKNAGHGLLTSMATLALFASGAGLLGAGIALVATNGVLSLRNNRSQPNSVILKDFLQKCMSTIGAIAYGGIAITGLSYVPGLEAGAVTLIAPVVGLLAGGPLTKPFADILATKATEAIMSKKSTLATQPSVDKRSDNVIRVEVSKEASLREHKRNQMGEDLNKSKGEDRQNTQGR